MGRDDALRRRRTGQHEVDREPFAPEFDLLPAQQRVARAQGPTRAAARDLVALKRRPPRMASSPVS
jgi:hypothetical protein